MSSTPDEAEQPTDDVNDPNPSALVPDREDPLASAFASATQRPTQPGPTKTTGGGGSLGDLAREVSGTRSKTDEESDGDQQEA
jgi:hypothetical protein